MLALRGKDEILAGNTQGKSGNIGPLSLLPLPQDTRSQMLSFNLINLSNPVTLTESILCECLCVCVCVNVDLLTLF